MSYDTYATAVMGITITRENLAPIIKKVEERVRQEKRWDPLTGKRAKSEKITEPAYEYCVIDGKEFVVNEWEGGELATALADFVELPDSYIQFNDDGSLISVLIGTDICDVDFCGPYSAFGGPVNDPKLFDMGHLFVAMEKLKNELGIGYLAWGMHVWASTSD